MGAASSSQVVIRQTYSSNTRCRHHHCRHRHHCCEHCRRGDHCQRASCLTYERPTTPPADTVIVPARPATAPAPAQEALPPPPPPPAFPFVPWGAIPAPPPPRLALPAPPAAPTASAAPVEYEESSERIQGMLVIPDGCEVIVRQPARKKRNVLALKLPDGKMRYLTDSNGGLLAADYEGYVWVPEKCGYVRVKDGKIVDPPS